jgi:hypothetical protein
MIQVAFEYHLSNFVGDTDMSYGYIGQHIKDHNEHCR